MAIIQSSEHQVDQAGYVTVTPAVRCDLEAASTQVPKDSKTPLRNGVLRKRSRMLIRHHSGPPLQVIWVGGDGVSSIAYPLSIGDTLDLPVSANTLTFVRGGAGLGDSDVRTLELG